MAKPKKPTVSLAVYQPSDALVIKTQELLREYPLQDIASRFRVLSRGMNRDGEWLEEHTQGALSNHSADGLQNQAAAGDILAIVDMIGDIEKKKPLMRDPLNEDDNAHLKLFDGPHPRLPRIFKCLDATSQWCVTQMDELTEQADALIDMVKGASAEEASFIAKKINFIDETAGMMYRIKEWADVAVNEVNKARKAIQPDGRAA